MANVDYGLEFWRIGFFGWLSHFLKRILFLTVSTIDDLIKESKKTPRTRLTANPRTPRATQIYWLDGLKPEIAASPAGKNFSSRGERTNGPQFVAENA